MSSKNDNKMSSFKVNKDDFITFLSLATPEEVSKLISERGKPAKPFSPFSPIRNKKSVEKA